MRFRNEQNRTLQAKKKLCKKKTRQSQRQAFNKCKESSPDHIREITKQALLN